MLRTLIPCAMALGVALTAIGPAHANCAAPTKEALYTSNRSCPEEIRKVSCGGNSVDLMADTSACCKLRQAKSVKWRCGTDEALRFECRGKGKNADFLSVRKTAAGVRFVCLGEKVVVAPEQPPAPPPAAGGAGGGE
ncbi:MAG: hypothetical protein AAGH68_03365 [Pseudomonadota bacterium]